VDTTIWVLAALRGCELFKANYITKILGNRPALGDLARVTEQCIVILVVAGVVDVGFGAQVEEVLVASEP
jgi:hypothetical protein